MYGVPTFLTMESRTYNAGNLRGGGTWEWLGCPHSEMRKFAKIHGRKHRRRLQWSLYMEKRKLGATHSLNVILQNSRYRFGMLNVLLCNQGQIRDRISVIGDEIIKRVSIILRNFIRRDCRHDWEDCSGHSQKRKETVARVARTNDSSTT